MLCLLVNYYTLESFRIKSSKSQDVLCTITTIPLIGTTKLFECRVHILHLFRYNMLVDGCPDDEDLTRIFHFEYLKTSQPFTTIFQWQNFIFRDGAEEQVLVYECEVAPCYDNCQPSCGNRKRRNQPETVIQHESFNPTRFNFQLEVYKTREALVEALRARKNEYTQEMLITICSSVLMFGLVLGMATYWMSR